MPLDNPHPVYLLLADTQPSDYTRLAEAAQSKDMTVLQATTGRDAIRLARQCRPQLCLVNSCLPDMSGFEVLESLRGELPASTFFLIGNEYRKEDELRALAIGATIYVCKPVQASWITACKPRESGQLFCSFKPDWPEAEAHVSVD
jgi:DNA-binding response OmpR family regulator